MHELNMHKIRPEKSDQAIGPELQVTSIPRFQDHSKVHHSQSKVHKTQFNSYYIYNIRLDSSIKYNFKQGC